MRRLIDACVFSVPRAGRHARRCNKFNYLIIRDQSCAVQDRHAAVDHIKCKMLRAAEFRADNFGEDRDFLRAIQTIHVKAAAFDV